MDVVCNDAHWYAWLLNNTCMFTVEDQDECRWLRSLWLSPRSAVHWRLVEGRNKDLTTSISRATEATWSYMPYHGQQVRVTWQMVNMKLPTCTRAVVRQWLADIALQLLKQAGHSCSLIMHTNGRHRKPLASWKSTRPSRFFSCMLKNMGRPGYEASVLVLLV